MVDESSSCAHSHANKATGGREIYTSPRHTSQKFPVSDVSPFIHCLLLVPPSSCCRKDKINIRQSLVVLGARRRVRGEGHRKGKRKRTATRGNKRVGQGKKDPMFAPTPHPFEVQASTELRSTHQLLQKAAVVGSQQLSVILGTIAASPLLQTLAAGGCAGAVSRTCTAPLDRLKVLAQEGRALQASRPQWMHAHPTLVAASSPWPGSAAAPHLPQRMHLSDLARRIYHTEGAAAFWRGNGVNCLKAGPEQAIAFSTRRFYLDLVCLQGNPTFLQNCVVGSLAGVSAQALLYPMEVVKTRMAVADRHEYHGIVDCFRQSLQRGGVRDLYKGLCANAAGIVPHRGLEMGTFFTLDRKAKEFYGERTVPLVVTLATGFVASLVSQVVTYPLNLARTKLQTQGVNGRPVLYRGLGHCLSSVWQEQGLRGWFVGLCPNMMKAVPASMLMYVTYSQVTAALEGHRAAALRAPQRH